MMMDNRLSSDMLHVSLLAPANQYDSNINALRFYLISNENWLIFWQGFIRNQQENTCIYHRMYLSYKTGLGKVYSEQEIERAKARLGRPSCIGKNVLRIHPSMQEVIVSLKSAKNRPTNPYSLDNNTSAYHDTLDALRLSLCSLRGSS